MLILAIDTSAIASAAILRAGADGTTTTLAAFASEETNNHSEVLAPAVAGLLEEAGLTGGQLDRIIVGVGPGPFTGLRVGLVTARTLGFAWGVPVQGMMSLDAIAGQVLESGRETPFTVAIDARRKEVYWAAYDGAGNLLSGPEVTTAEQVPSGEVFGAGAGIYAQRLAAAGAVADPQFLAHHPTADALGRRAVQVLAAGGALLPTTPLYLRESDAKVPAAMLKGRNA
ncbi:tRNA (adenosine(37)-N6)-threonylcarbamoyltransferase complex dimerization subunit type 1 TsaB [Paeniglutamicibacter cryotolerans]|uniref:tRNA threonylcarbamoyl adenosine modification protein YeaZ n=1 Tax=Paeniglutamicibacter cryotolerans TaxID=670079 RepID=A0A839QDE5_9MICC|nr:tRNA (adenosine(37)-N6)-threonylcarbamoyltransferase complex dimerization subunit type 1 TsaB [Paeniglutamicibacter cryotolerans]MBB2993920.1 tRNA threonylcarbamoyl adenosine modification protein YeaZ [Paeniglutamicibacter cryotolerans]